MEQLFFKETGAFFLYLRYYLKIIFTYVTEIKIKKARLKICIEEK